MNLLQIIYSLQGDSIEETLGLVSKLMIQQNYLGTLDTEPKVERGCLGRGVLDCTFGDPRLNFL